jgi:hypothetical protein
LSLATKALGPHELEPVHRYQVLDPAEFRVSGYDDGVHAHRGRHCESIRVRNREAGFDPDSVENLTE